MKEVVSCVLSWIEGKFCVKTKGVVSRDSKSKSFAHLFISRRCMHMTWLTYHFYWETSHPYIHLFVFYWKTTSYIIIHLYGYFITGVGYLIAVDIFNTYWFTINCGLNRRCQLSPLLFNIAINGLAMYIFVFPFMERKVCIQLYVNEMLMLTNTEKELQTLLDNK